MFLPIRTLSGLSIAVISVSSGSGTTLRKGRGSKRPTGLVHHGLKTETGRGGGIGSVCIQG